MKIVVTKKDEVSAIVHTEPGILQEISDFFTFEIPNKQFNPKVRARIWDGKIRIFSYGARELPIGLLDHLKKFAEDRDYEYDDSYFEHVGENITLEEAEEFCNTTLKLTGGPGNFIEARDYQVNAVYRAIRDGRHVFLSATGSGKSLIIYAIMRWHFFKSRRCLIVVPTTSLVEQMKSDFISYSVANGWSEDNIHVIYSGKEKASKAKVVITTWQSVYKMPEEFFSQFDVIFGDEAHLFKAKSLQSIFKKCKNIKYRIGTSGTLDGTQVNKLVLEGMFGSVLQVSRTRDLIDDGALADLRIDCVELKYKDEERKAVKGMSYQEEIDFIVRHERRNKFLRNLALAQKGNTLLLFQYVEKHGKVLYEMIKEKAAEGRKVFFVYGGTDTSVREEIRVITEKEDDAIIVASYGTFSTGINIRRLHNLILGSPTKSRIRNLQSLGRGLRKADGKDQCRVYDIGDNFIWKSHKNTTYKHLIARIKYYNEEELDYKISEVQL